MTRFVDVDPMWAAVVALELLSYNVAVAASVAAPAATATAAAAPAATAAAAAADVVCR